MSVLLLTGNGDRNLDYIDVGDNRMLVTLCWSFFGVGDSILMFVIYFGCWCPMLMTKTAKLSPTSKSCRKHISSPTFVTNIDVAGIWAWTATNSKRPKYCASEHASCINGPGWYECDCIAPYVGASGNYCEYFNYCNNDWSTPCHETALCQYGPVFSQGNVKNWFGMNLVGDFQLMVENLQNS